MNFPPSQILLDNNNVVENISGGHIANISGLDNDFIDGDELNFTIISSTLENLIEINGTELKFKSGEYANYEQTPNFNITIKATDKEGEFVNKQFNINVIDDLNDNFYLEKTLLIKFMTLQVLI